LNTAGEAALGPTLILGIGNILMGDEGVGVEVVRELERRSLPPGVECLDGGTGSLTLLGPMGAARRIILVDATVNGEVPGTVQRLRPRFSTDYPRTLTAHDIGLKDLLDAFHLLGDECDVTLFAVSIDLPKDLQVGLTEEMAAHVSDIADLVLQEFGEGFQEAVAG
jgi:hydrogenase maturation protease